MSWIASQAFGFLKAYSRIAPTGRGAYRLVRGARSLFARERWNDWFETPDHIQMELDLGTYPDCCMAVGLYELDTYRAIKKSLRPGDWFVDCGANIGYFSLCAAQWVGATGRVDAFEPDPINRARLEKHLLRNGLECPIRVHAVGVADRPGLFDLFHPASSDKVNHGSASMFAELVPHGEKFTIRTVRLDRFIDGVPRLIKMDIEGAEFQALEGMSGILAAAEPPDLIVEHNVESIEAAGHRAGDIFTLLAELQPRYGIYWIGSKLVRIPSAEVLSRMTRQGNLLATVR